MLFIFYPKFNSIGLSVFSLAALMEKSPSKGVGVPSVDQSRSGFSLRRRGWETGPLY